MAFCLVARAAALLAVGLLLAGCDLATPRVHLPTDASPTRQGAPHAAALPVAPNPTPTIRAAARPGPQQLYQQAQAYRQRRQWVLAVQTLEELQARSPNYRGANELLYDTYVQMARDLATSKDYSGAVNALEWARAIHRLDPRAADERAQWSRLSAEQGPAPVILVQQPTVVPTVAGQAQPGATPEPDRAAGARPGGGQAGGVRVGMSRVEALAAWGPPSRILRSRVNGHAVEQWQYAQPGRTVVVVDDAVTSFKE